MPDLELTGWEVARGGVPVWDDCPKRIPIVGWTPSRMMTGATMQIRNTAPRSSDRVEPDLEIRES